MHFECILKVHFESAFCILHFVIFDFLPLCQFAIFSTPRGLSLHRHSLQTLPSKKQRKTQLNEQPPKTAIFHFFDVRQPDDRQRQQTTSHPIFLFEDIFCFHYHTLYVSLYDTHSAIHVESPGGCEPWLLFAHPLTHCHGPLISHFTVRPVCVATREVVSITSTSTFSENSVGSMSGYSNGKRRSL